MKTLLQTLLIAFWIALAPVGFASDININTASAEELAAELKGVGLNKAKAIVAYREEYGSFKSVDELSGVKGIGLKTVDANREAIRLEAED